MAAAGNVSSTALGSKPRRAAEVRPSQVSLKTVLTVTLGVLAVVAAVAFAGRTLVAVALTLVAMMIAVTLNHGVAFLRSHRVPRGLAIGIVLVAGAGVIAGLGLLVIPVAISQGKELAGRLPTMLQDLRGTRVFHGLDDRFHISRQVMALEKELPKLVQGAAAPVWAVLGGLVSGVVGIATIAVLSIFMLIFGGSLVHELLREALPGRRPLYSTLIEKGYDSIGGYLRGLALICLINATLTTVFLAIIGVPFFLPLGILSGLSSLIPYAGPVVMGALVSVITLATKGAGSGLACVIYFLAYGQLEGQVLSPVIFRKTVHVNPLVVVLAVLFFGELAGIIGAVLAVPAAATIQIVAREILRIRRERMHLAMTPLNSPDRDEREAGAEA